MSNNAETAQTATEGEMSNEYSFDDAFDKGFEELSGQEAEGIGEEGEEASNTGDEEELIYGLEPTEYERRRAEGWQTKEEWVEKGGDPEDWRPYGTFKAMGDMLSEQRSLKEQLRKQQQAFEEKLAQVIKYQKDQQKKTMQSETAKLEQTLEDRAQEALDSGDFAEYHKINKQIVKLQLKHELEASYGDDDEDEAPPAPTQKETSMEAFREQTDAIEAKFAANNPWYEQHEDLQDYVAAQTVVNFQRNPEAGMEAALEAAAERARNSFKDHVAFKRQTRAANKVADTSTRGNARAPKGKGWANVPEDMQKWYFSSGLNDKMSKEEFARINSLAEDR